MTTYNLLQNYWWLIMSVLGALLVFLLMVQGGQSMLIHYGKPDKRALLINSMGRKWELTYTTLVTFGGAFFASFPLFYSTSFGGAYWLWMLILFSFVIQAISYEYRSKPGNIYGSRFYDTLLLINGIVGPVLLGVAVATMFFGAEFTVTKSNILNVQAATISTWGPLHGLEALAYAMKSKWNTTAQKRRHVIVVWSDDGTHDLGFGKSAPNYPANMAADFNELTRWWGSRTSPGVMDESAKRLIIFAPNKKSWNKITDNWNNVIQYESEAGDGLADCDYEQILSAIGILLFLYRKCGSDRRF